jgi:hypothetical protein
MAKWEVPMGNAKAIIPSKITQSNVRKATVTILENSIKEAIDQGTLEDKEALTNTRHIFTPVYEKYGCCALAKELTMPKGMTLVGKLHRHAHLTFLMQGKVMVVSEFGEETIEAPATFVSPAGTKRAFYVLEDAILTMVHVTEHTSEEDIGKIEEEVISPTYSAMGLPEPELEIIHKQITTAHN